MHKKLWLVEIPVFGVTFSSGELSRRLDKKNFMVYEIYPSYCFTFKSIHLVFINKYTYYDFINITEIIKLCV